MMVSHVAFAVHSLQPLAIKGFRLAYIDLGRSCRACTVVLLESFPSFHTIPVLMILF